MRSRCSANSFTPSHVTLPPFGPHIIMRPALDAS